MITVRKSLLFSLSKQLSICGMFQRSQSTTSYHAHIRPEIWFSLIRDPDCDPRHSEKLYHFVLVFVLLAVDNPESFIKIRT